MRNIITIFILLLSITCTSQIRLNKNLKYAASAQFIAGAADGVNQSYLFHYHGQFGSIKPNSVAWVNKWKLDKDGNPIVGVERFWQSSRALVFVTDFHHATRFVENRANESSLLIYAIGHDTKRKKWYWYVADIGILYISRSIGFYTTYNLIYK